MINKYPAASRRGVAICHLQPDRRSDASGVIHLPCPPVSKSLQAAAVSDSDGGVADFSGVNPIQIHFVFLKGSRMFKISASDPC